MSKIKSVYVDPLIQTTTLVSTQKVTCSNTLSKDFEIDVCEGEDFKKAFFCQELSAKEALDAAIGFADEVKDYSKTISSMYPEIAKELDIKASFIQRICSNWNEDELEVVDATEL